LTHSTATYHPEANETKSTHHHLPRRRRPGASPGTATVEEKSLSEYLSLLQRSDCREAGAIRGEYSMKQHLVQLTQEEQKKLARVLKIRHLKDIRAYVRVAIQRDWMQLR